MDCARVMGYAGMAYQDGAAFIESAAQWRAKEGFQE